MRTDLFEIIDEQQSIIAGFRVSLTYNGDLSDPKTKVLIGIYLHIIDLQTGYTQNHCMRTILRKNRNIRVDANFEKRCFEWHGSKISAINGDSIFTKFEEEVRTRGLSLDNQNKEKQ